MEEEKMESVTENGVDSSMEPPPKKSRKLCSSPSTPLKELEKVPDSNDENYKDCENGNLASATMTPPHPLLDIHLVLGKVISYMDKGSYKTASLVCKTWSTAVRKVMLKKMVLNFTEKTGSDFLKDHQDNNSFPFLRSDTASSSIRLSLKLFSWKTNCYGVDKSDKTAISFKTALALVEKFVQMNTVIADLKLEFCPGIIIQAWMIIRFLHEQLERLDITTTCACNRDVHPLARENLSRTMFDCDELLSVDFKNAASSFCEETVSFPKLKILSGKYKESSDEKNVKNLYKKLLLGSRALEGLHCKGCHQKMFEVLAQKPDVFNHLKSLSHVYLNEEELQLLLKKRLKLSSLSMSLHSGFRYPTLGKFLSSLGESLKTLNLDFFSLPKSIPEQFPCGESGINLVNLQHLSMKKFFGSIHFVSHMPHLETLTLEDVNLSLTLQHSSEYQYKSKLKSLKIFDSVGSTGRYLLPTVYHDIVSFFPDLTHLRMEYFTDSTLKIILKGLPHLEELDIPKGVYSDRILIERSLPDREPNSNEENDPDCSSQSKENGDTDKANCLADLKKLRKVILQSPKITDSGIRYGLLYCRELRSVYIDSPMISDAGLKLLCQNGDIQHLEFVNCYQLTSSGIKEARQLWGKGSTLTVNNK